MTYQIRNKYMAQGDQVKNGKAFEYAIARTYVDYLRNNNLNVVLADNKALNVAKAFYEDFSEEEKDRYNECAFQTIDTMMRLRHGKAMFREKGRIKALLHISRKYYLTEL